MLKRVDPQLIYPENKLYLDYIAGQGAAISFFTHPLMEFEAAAAARRKQEYPREQVCGLLRSYNAGLQADPTSLEAVEALSSESTFCVIGGQQVGFLGGPVYTLYKIVTTIRLADYLEKRLGVKVVPLFWLASDDHDFTEINRAYLLKRDGEVGAVRFEWKEQGRPIADLPVTDEVLAAYHTYFDELPCGPHYEVARQLFAPAPQEDYCGWHARLWSRLFSSRGLVLVSPTLLRGPARFFFRAALSNREEIERCLQDVAVSLQAAGYPPTLSPERAGRLYTFAANGRRIRVEDSSTHLAKVNEQPERYSTDAALRPLLADSLLPIVASVLGPGELAYHAMLRPLYSLFCLPQPLLFPRTSCTVIAPDEADLIARCSTSAFSILTGEFDAQHLRRLASKNLQAEFAKGREAISRALEPLQAPLGTLDPGLARTWRQTRATSLHALDDLEQRAIRVELAKRGISPGLFQRLQNALRPRNRPQERVFPLPHFVNRHGLAFVDTLFSIGKLGDFAHHLITWEDDNG